MLFRSDMRLGGKRKIDEAKEQRVGEKRKQITAFAVFENATEKEKKESRATAEKRSAYNYNASHIASQAYLSPPTNVVLALPFLSRFIFFFSFFTKVAGTIDSILKHG